MKAYFAVPIFKLCINRVYYIEIIMLFVLKPTVIYMTVGGIKNKCKWRVR